MKKERWVSLSIRVEHPKTQQNLPNVETRSRNRLLRFPCHTRWQYSYGYQGVTWLVQNLLRPKTTNPNPSILCAPSAIQHFADTCQLKSYRVYYYSIFCLMLQGRFGKSCQMAPELGSSILRTYIPFFEETVSCNWN